jgi:hypothetical protein
LTVIDAESETTTPAVRSPVTGPPLAHTHVLTLLVNGAKSAVTLRSDVTSSSVRPALTLASLHPVK